MRLLLVVSCLWIFAFITGLSASVMRSVTMFSAVALGIALKRSKSQFQTLLISLFVLLLIRPNFIYDVGFQLSYLAVFGILWLMPVAMLSSFPNDGEATFTHSFTNFVTIVEW